MRTVSLPAPLKACFGAQTSEARASREVAHVEGLEHKLADAAIPPKEVAAAAKALIERGPASERRDALMAKIPANTTASALAWKSMCKVLHRRAPTDSTATDLALAYSALARSSDVGIAAHYDHQAGDMLLKFDPSTLTPAENVMAAKAGLSRHREDPRGERSGYAHDRELLKQALQGKGTIERALASLRDRVVPGPFRFKHGDHDLGLLDDLAKIDPTQLSEKGEDDFRSVYATLVDKATLPSASTALAPDRVATATKILENMPAKTAQAETIGDALRNLRRTNQEGDLRLRAMSNPY